MKVALYLLTIIATILAWSFSRRRPEHRPVVLTLVAGLLAQAARQALLWWVLPPPNPNAAPLEGALRLAIATDRALYIAWPAALAALAVRVLAQRPTWPVGLGYVAASVALAVTYPATRFDVLRKAYLACELVALFIGVVSFISWWVREKRRASVTEITAGVLVAGHFMTLIFGPYRLGLFGTAFELERWSYVAVLIVVISVHIAGSLWTSEKG
jgi:hypothetical protein